VQAIKAAKFEDRYDALDELLDQEEAEPIRQAVKPRIPAATRTSR
jgi:hypothetical protein